MKVLTPFLAAILLVALTTDVQAQRRTSGDHAYFLLLELDSASLERAQFGSRIDQVWELLNYEGIALSNVEIEGEWIWVALYDQEEAERIATLLREKIPELEVTRSGKNLRAEFSDAYLGKQRRELVDEAMHVIAKKLQENGIQDAELEPRDGNRIYIGLQDKIDQQILENLNKPKVTLSFRFILDEVDPASDKLPDNASLLPTGETFASGEPVMVVVSGEEIVNGDMLTDAQASMSQGYPVILFSFDDTGRGKLCEATKANIGRSLAIVLDGTVVSYPTIQGAICGGSGQITGNYTMQEAQEIAARLRSSDLPVPITILELGKVPAD